MTTRAMKIDRASFVALTCAIFGCNTGSGAAASTPVSIPSQPTAPSAVPAASNMKTEEDKRADEEALAAKEQEDEDVLYDRVTDDSQCGWVDPKRVPRICGEDETNAPPTCKLRQCNGLATSMGFPEAHCESYRASFKPSTAARALRCLERLKSAETCSSCNIYRCGEIALKRACLDPQADATCVQIASKCKSVSMAECRGYLSGMNAVGRAKMLACLSSPSGCGFGIFSCTEGL